MFLNTVKRIRLRQEELQEENLLTLLNRNAVVEAVLR